MLSILSQFKKKGPSTGTDGRVWYYEVFYEATRDSLIMVKYCSNAEAGDSAFKTPASVPLNRLVNYFGRWLPKPLATQNKDTGSIHCQPWHNIRIYRVLRPPPPNTPTLFIYCMCQKPHLRINDEGREKRTGFRIQGLLKGAGFMWSEQCVW